MFSGRKLAFTLVFTGLITFFFGVSCRGFFTSPVLQSIAINPTSPELGIGQTETLTVYGTDDTGNRYQLKNGVSWSIDGNGTATLVAGASSATITGVAPGSANITASAQALSATATATVIGNVTQISVTPTSGSVTIGDTTGASFTFAGSPGPPDYITTGDGGTLTITSNAGVVNDGLITCVVSTDSNSNPDELCTAESGAASSYTLVMTYPSPSGGTISSPTVTLSVSQ